MLVAPLEKAMLQIRERETQFYNIFFYSSDGIMIFNKEGKVLVANPAFFAEDPQLLLLPIEE